jgi:hypothetical protein
MTCRGEEQQHMFWWAHLKVRDHLEDLSIDGTLMLKYIVKKWDGKMWTGLIWHRIQWVGSCTVRSIKYGEFLHWLRNYQLLKKDSAACR